MNDKVRGMIETVERYANRQFLFRGEIGMLLEASEKQGMSTEFEELAFTGKFIKNARNILARDKLDPAAAARLSGEMRINLEKSVRIIAALIEKIPPDEKDLIAGRFLNLTGNNLENLLDLVSELSWFKNYSLDKKNP